MIKRDEENKIISADSISDVTKALAKIEKELNNANKNGMENLDDDEKQELLADMQDLKVLLGLVTPEMQKNGKAVELISYLKQIMKIKSAAENFKKINGDIM